MDLISNLHSSLLNSESKIAEFSNESGILNQKVKENEENEKKLLQKINELEQQAQIKNSKEILNRISGFESD